MRILLIHQNFPGQFLHLAAALRVRSHQVLAVGAANQPWAHTGARYLPSGGNPSEEQRRGTIETLHRAQLKQGRRVEQVLRQLTTEGWVPDLVIGHPGWGDLLFLDNVFPAAPLVALMELDLGGLTGLRGVFCGQASSGEAPARSADLGLRSWTDQMAARRMLWGLTATAFQRSTYPSWLQSRIEVIHEGVDGKLCHPDPLAHFQVPGGPRLSRSDAVVSFAARWLEPLRGFPQFMRALPALMRNHPHVQIVIAGRAEQGGYGPPPRGHASWKVQILQELASQLDVSRIHFCGLLPHADLIRLFQITTIHVYLTLPYVLSWSLLEAMACGALIVGSRTQPVEEVIRPGWNGLLTDLDDPSALSALLLSVLRDPSAHQACRAAARRSVLRHYERGDCMDRQVRWLECLTRQATTNPAAPG